MAGGTKRSKAVLQAERAAQMKEKKEIKEKRPLLEGKLEAVNKAIQTLRDTANKIKNIDKITLRKWIKLKHVKNIAIEMEKQSKMLCSKGMRLEQLQLIRNSWPLEDKKHLKKNALKHQKLVRKLKGQNPEKVSTVQSQVRLVLGPQLAVPSQGMLMFAPLQQPGSVLDLQGHADGEASNPQFQLLMLAPNPESHFGEANNVQGQFEVLPQHQGMVPILHYQQPGPSREGGPQQWITLVPNPQQYPEQW